MSTQSEFPENNITVTLNYRNVRDVLLCRWIDREGIAVRIPRNQINSENFGKFPESGYNAFQDKACLYILLSRDNEENSTAYIGESVSITKRLMSHKSSTNENWDDVIVFCRNDTMFDKGHILYIEEQLFLHAREIGQYIILNDGKNQRKTPFCTIDPAYEKAANDFVESIKLVCEMLGYELFKHKVAESPKCEESAE